MGGMYKRPQRVPARTVVDQGCCESSFMAGPVRVSAVCHPKHHGLPTLRGASAKTPAISSMTAEATASGSCSAIAAAAEHATTMRYGAAATSLDANPDVLHFVY